TPMVARLGPVRKSLEPAEFMRRTGHPKGRKGYVVDHIIPLECDRGTFLQICSGRPFRKRRLKTGAKETADEGDSRTVAAIPILLTSFQLLLHLAYFCPSIHC